MMTDYSCRAARVLVIVVAVLVGIRSAHGQPGSGAARTLRQAAAAVEAGEYERAQALALSVLQAADAQPAGTTAPAAAPGSTPKVSTGISAGASIDRQDRAEAWRLYGLALFFQGRLERAELAFVEYLKVDYEGRLDPALVPPEAIVFFAEVRSRHAAELRAYRPVAPRKRMWALNLLPPAGQFQNRQPVKAWVLAGAGAVLLATNITTYAVLRNWCDATTGVCGDGDSQSSAGTGRVVRAVNLGSGVLFAAAVAYGMIDGFYHYRQSDQDRDHQDSAAIDMSASETTVGITPSPGGAYVLIHGRF